MTISPILIDEIIKLYKDGKSDVEIMDHLNITKKQFKQYYDSSEVFRKAVDQGAVYCEAWWAKQGRQALGDKGFNVQVWKMVMQNSFGWADKSEVKDQTKPVEQKTTEQLEAEAKAYFEAKARLAGVQH
jgi:hypothetical protein